MSKAEDSRRISEAAHQAAVEAAQIAEIARAVAAHAFIVAERDHVSDAEELAVLREVLVSLRNMARDSERDAHGSIDGVDAPAGE
jgi:hypothetical protein